MRSGSVIQLQTETFSRKAEIKVEWSIYSSSKYNLWGSDTEDHYWRGI